MSLSPFLSCHLFMLQMQSNCSQMKGIQPFDNCLCMLHKYAPMNSILAQAQPRPAPTRRWL